MQLDFFLFFLMNMLALSMSLSVDLAQYLHLSVGFCSHSCLPIGITCGVWKNSHVWAPNTRDSDIIGVE